MKKMIAIGLITLLSASALMLSVGTYRAQADSYYAKVGYPGADEFCYCIHIGDYADDTWATLGMIAYYDPYENYSYSWVYWIWDTGVGWNDQHNYWFNDTPECTCAYDQYGWWSGDVFDMPGEPQKIGDRWYWDYENGGSISPSANKISGVVYESFYEEGNPTNIHYIGVQPSPVDQLTAQEGPPVYYYDPS